MRFSPPLGLHFKPAKRTLQRDLSEMFLFLHPLLIHMQSAVQIVLQNLPLSRRFQWALSRVDYASNMFAHFYATPGFVRALLLNCAHFTFRYNEHFNKSHDKLYR